MPATQIAKKSVKVRGLTPWQVICLRFRLRQAACSETWVDAQIVSQTHTDDEGDEVAIVRFDSRVFPPGGRHETRMRWCRTCGRYTPRPEVHLIEHRHERFGPVISATLQCDDCHIGEDEEIHRELHQAGLHLQPSGSQSFILRRDLHNERKKLQ